MLLCLVGVPCFRFVVASVYFICFPFLCLLRFIALVGFLLPFVVFGLFPSPNWSTRPRVLATDPPSPGPDSRCSQRGERAALLKDLRRNLEAGYGEWGILLHMAFSFLELVPFSVAFVA